MIEIILKILNVNNQNNNCDIFENSLINSVS